MAITFSCACGKEYRVADAYAGKRVRCRQCGGEVQVPANEAEQPEQTAFNPFSEEAIEAEKHVGAAAPQQRLAGFPGQYDDAEGPGARATNPARLRVNWGRYFLCHPGIFIFQLIATAIACEWGYFVGSEGFLIVMGMSLFFTCAFLFFRMREVYWRFRYGEVNPAVAIGRNRVAVFTDLRRSRNVSRPAIRVVSVPLWRLAGGPVKVGQRLSAPALYGGDFEGGWQDFAPQVTNCATDDPQALEYLLTSIPEQDWQRLDNGLNTLGGKLHPGLYRLYGTQRGKRTRFRRVEQVAVGYLIFGMMAFSAVVMPPVAKVLKNAPPAHQVLRRR